MVVCELCGRELSVSKSDQKSKKGKYSTLCPCQYEKKRFKGPGLEGTKGKRVKVTPLGNETILKPEDLAERESPKE